MIDRHVSCLFKNVNIVLKIDEITIYLYLFGSLSCINLNVDNV